MIDHDLRDYYTNRYDEAGRLGANLRGQVEEARVRELLGEYLPAGGAVVDIGGGTGAHATWLQSRGHQVWLLDPIQRHVDQAQAAGVPSLLGDARKLPWPDGCFDAAVALGPLYHLTDPMDRRAALSEAARVVRPGGVVVVQALNRFTNLIGATIANQLTRRRDVVEDIEQYGHSQRHDRMTASTYYHHVAELHGELDDAGLHQAHVRGLTGPGGWLAVVVDRWAGHDTLNGYGYRMTTVPDALVEEDPLTNAIEGARMADRHPELAVMSGKLLGIGWREPL